MHLFRLIALLATLGVLILPAASAGTISFATALAPGNLGSSVSTGGLTITGWEVSKSTPSDWISRTINNRREGPDDLGLGVCPAGSIANCPATGNGDINEIDNNGTYFDVLRLQVASGYQMNSIGLSSLDSGLKDAFAIFGSNSGNPNFGALTLLAHGSNSSMGTVNPLISIGTQFTYYYIAPDKRGNCDSNSDFLVSSADLTTLSRVPEPFTMSLAGAGLILLGVLRRRR